MHLVMRSAILAIVAAVNTCGAVGGTSAADLATAVKTSIKDLQASEVQCSGDAVHPAACDAAEALVTADLTKVQAAEGAWQPLFSQLTAKDALAAASQGNLDPTKSLADTRVIRLLLERVQPALSVPTVSLAPHASAATTTLPTGYAKQLQIVLPGLATEADAASGSCATQVLESCRVDVLVAAQGVARVSGGYGALVVSPADVAIDAVLKPMLGDLSTQLGTAGDQLATGQPVDKNDPGLWSAAATEFTSAAGRLAS